MMRARSRRRTFFVAMGRVIRLPRPLWARRPSGFVSVAKGAGQLCRALLPTLLLAGVLSMADLAHWKKSRLRAVAVNLHHDRGCSRSRTTAHSHRKLAVHGRSILGTDHLGIVTGQ
jgi:hypothetical protein